MTCERVAQALGGYVLGVLGEDEAAQVRAHLDRCPACAEQARGHGAVAALLELAPEEAYDPTGRGSVGLQRVLDRVADERRTTRRRRVLQGLAGAASVAVLAGLGGAALAGRETAVPPAAVATSPAPDRVDRGQDPVTGVSVAVDVARRSWGSALQLRLAGVPAGEHCRLVAEGRDGSREVGATWAVPSQGYSAGSLTVAGAVGLQPDTIGRFVVETTAGRRLVSTG